MDVGETVSRPLPFFVARQRDRIIGPAIAGFIERRLAQQIASGGESQASAAGVDQCHQGIEILPRRNALVASLQPEVQLSLSSQSYSVLADRKGEPECDAAAAVRLNVGAERRLPDKSRLCVRYKFHLRAWIEPRPTLRRSFRAQLVDLF